MTKYIKRQLRKAKRQMTDNNKPTLSIVILNYNTKDLLIQCLKSLIEVKLELDFEIIVVDNGSIDNSVKAVQDLDDGKSPVIKIVKNDQNLGFAKGNNAARQYCEGQYVLFLNSDTIVNPGVLSESIEFMKLDQKIGVLTVKQVMLNGNIDPDSRRSFPTPWVSLTHFSKLDRLFPHTAILSKYWYSHIDPNLVIDIDVSQGAFFLNRKKVLDQVDWFSEDYFLDGEDIDLSWKIKGLGYRIVYYPKVWIYHLKKQTKKLSTRYVSSGVDSMEIFYRKHMWSNYPFFVNWLVILGIRFIKFLRSIKVLFLNK
ncbi:glycosyltransferase family 2 protein [Candidatus Microgenomates bacterium]|nr:glycosyltransferase family 2 protein [Candidatus Microgenomates bacterium]